MGILSNLEPREVFAFFEEISSIPHGSGNTKEISDYLVSFAKDNGFEHYKDRLNNVIIIKEASTGYENSEPLIIQSHMDMVCEKLSDCTKDMSKETIDLICDGDLVKADGTTLGADDGIGMAYALAILSDDSLLHPRIEAVFTVDEEIGLIGAFGIDVSPLKGKKMLNLDTGDDKTFTVSCAGGVTVKTEIDVCREDFNGSAYEIVISNLSGGHSGESIHKGSANSNSLMARLLSMIKSKCGIRISSVNGGFKDNAIPVETKAVVVVDNPTVLEETVLNAKDIFKNEYSVTDSIMDVSFSKTEYSTPLDKESTDKIIFACEITPTGVQKMSDFIEGLVETSLNFAIIKTGDSSVQMISSVRSSTDTQKDMLTQKLTSLAAYIGAKTEIYGDYPGWKYNPDSSFRNLANEVYKDKFGFAPNSEAIHAGLECGLFSGMIEGLECISYGPDMWDIHTPFERLSVSSVQRVWEFIKELLKRMK